MENLQCAVVDVQSPETLALLAQWFLVYVSYIGSGRRDDFSDSRCAQLHKKKLITKEPRGRLKNLHLT